MKTGGDSSATKYHFAPWSGTLARVVVLWKTYLNSFASGDAAVIIFEIISEIEQLEHSQILTQIFVAIWRH